jgi:putative phosphoribosyl transferase
MNAPAAIDAEVKISAGVDLAGHLNIPVGAQLLVLFVHGSGSSRHSPRNQFVAHVLQSVGLGTLLFDLLTPSEAADRGNVFDIELLATRVDRVRTWITANEHTRQLHLGLFGASTGAAAALVSAARNPETISAIVSRGGRPDLAQAWLPDVQAPTLFIVGELDHHVLQWNEAAARALRCPHRLEVVPGATHLFEEPGTLDIVAELAATWFLDHAEIRAEHGSRSHA